MLSTWEPPELTFLNTSKPPKDFIDFHLTAPTVSQNAMERLLPLIGEYCEFLPLMQFKKRQYYSINVLNVVDCLDVSRSDVLYSSENPGKVLSIGYYHFLDRKLPNDPIFMIPNDHAIFVRTSFVDCVRDNMLTNAKFGDPAVDPVYFIVRGIDTNIVPYLAT